MLKVIVVLVGALGIAGLASAAGQADNFRLRASLSPGAEVPKPKGVPAGARGLFTGRSVELENDKARLNWKLTFSNLSGRAVAAHIHLGRKGKAGAVLLALCGPCRSGQGGRKTISHVQHNRIEAGLTYVNVHTPRNPAGEIRGQIRVTELD
jgi:hypothetical protein